jgi:excisionase family DNA binding protein
MSDEAAVLTLPEVADFLRTEPKTVQQLIERGELAAFKVAGEWRVLEPAILRYLREQMEATRMEAFERTITDPRTWARILDEMPADETARLRKDEFEEGTFGAWLQDAMKTEEAERSAENVVPLDKHRE